MTRRRGVLALAILTIVAATAFWFARDRSPASGGEDGKAPEKAASREPRADDKREVPRKERDETLTRAQVWRSPDVPVSRARFTGAATIKELSCKFKLTELGGTTPKFDCIADQDEEIRIKYGKGPEIPAEAAATRLLHALGFGADDITLVEKLRCYGCPEEPFSTMRIVEVTGATPVYKTVINHDEFEEFDWVARERKFEARPIESEKLEGWSFFELDSIDPAKGGAPRAHVDALRLLAVMIAHWDNKSENQRLVCLSPEWDKKSPCPAPFLMLQDVGATFGPTKVDLDAWTKSPVWSDRATCTVSMQAMPYNGATFTDAKITEAGRQFIGKLLTQLSDAQIAELFTSARFDQKRGIFNAPRPVGEWVKAFKAKVQAITDGPACPAA